MGSARLKDAPGDYQQDLLSTLEAFSAYCDKTPGELVSFCFLRKNDTGERFLSVKRRQQMNEWIESFVQEKGWHGKEAVAKGNTVRGFLIHNGVLIQGNIWKGD